ncbi:gas vesicle protein [Streptomyces sp. NPDC001530]|uniref:gas vesicle protein GvpO n=1 Tax=Streptomyces sp. NPDC001530 TaxID=3364582 RepID=UPI0036C1F5AC
MITAERDESQKADTSKERFAKRSASGERVSAPEAMRCASEQLAELLGTRPESVSALKPTEQGWEARVEVVEVERIPETTSVMASYQVVLDAEGQLLAYERDNRYTRSQVDRERGVNQ